MRPLPTLERPDEAILASARREPLFKLEIVVVTPLFGGSAIARKVDADRPVSPQSVRGHLRFWWRACKAGAFVSLEELFDREAEIWGSVPYKRDPEQKNPQGGPSGVEIEITDYQHTEKKYCSPVPLQGNDGKYQRPSGFVDGYPPYALFPFQAELSSDRRNIKQYPADMLVGVKFRLLIFAPDALKSEIETALWAWVNFGGVGSRTRRGCGALYCDQFSPPSSNTALSVKHSAGSMVNPFSPTFNLLPHLFRARMLLGNKCSPKDAWVRAVDVMNLFRQGKNIGRNEGSDKNNPKKLGRSFWPEPNAIRLATGHTKGKHKVPDNAPIYYPRADFGYPIIFHFIDDPKDKGIFPPEPEQVILEGGRGQKRMASPFILKPLAVSEHEAYPMILLLTAPHVWNMEEPAMSLHSIKDQTLLADIAEQEIHLRSIGPMASVGGGKDNVRDAFMYFAAKQLNTTEVTLP